MKMKISENNEISSVNCNIEIKFNKKIKFIQKTQKKTHTHTQNLHS